MPILASIDVISVVSIIDIRLLLRRLAMNFEGVPLNGELTITELDVRLIILHQIISIEVLDLILGFLPLIMM